MMSVAVVGCESANVIYSPPSFSIPFNFPLSSALISAGLNYLFSGITQIFTPE